MDHNQMMREKYQRHLVEWSLLEGIPLQPPAPPQRTLTEQYQKNLSEWLLLEDWANKRPARTTTPSGTPKPES